MPIVRILIIGFLVWLALVLATRVLNRAKLKQQTKKDQTESPAPRIVRCAECGTYIPEKSAISRNGKHFCSDHA